MRSGPVLVLCLSATVAAGVCRAETYGDTAFPGGAASFADRVVDFALGDGVGRTFKDPASVIGPPDYARRTGAFALGDPGTRPDNLPDTEFGWITIEFTDNALTTSGDGAPDLYVFEVGQRVEAFTVEISLDNQHFLTIGTVRGQPTKIDIDGVPGVLAGGRYRFVRVTDATGGPASPRPVAGPDIDAIGAITSVPASPADGGTLPLLGGTASRNPADP